MSAVLAWGRVYSGGTVTVSTPVLDQSQTWNNVATTFTGWKLSITKTAAASASKPLDILVDGATIFSVRQDGVVISSGSYQSSGNIAISGSGNFNWVNGTQLDNNAGNGTLRIRTADGTTGATTLTAGANNLLSVNGPVKTLTTTVASLPAAGTAGRRAFVTDANATTFASVVASGGANGVPVYDDGTNWRIG